MAIQRKANENPVLEKTPDILRRAIAKGEGPPEPLYKQIKKYILALIDSYGPASDRRIPSENELVKTLRVSRMTVNRAFRELAAEGRLLRIQGVGSFAAPPKPQSALLEIVSIAEEIRRQGGVHSVKVHTLQSEPAPAHIARRLQLAPQARVYHAVLVHCDRECPVQLADRYVNPAVAPHFLEQDFTQMTPNEYLLSVAAITEVAHVIEAVLADRNARKLLQLQPGTPCLVLHRTTWSADCVATHSCFTYPGPRFQLGGRFKPGDSATRTIT